MVEGIEIRALTPAEAAAARDLVVWAAAAWGFGLNEDQIEERASKLAKAIEAADPDTEAFLVARSGADVVGHCRAVRDGGDPSQWWLSGLVVDPDHQRRGIATALARACIDHARRNGATVVRSEAHATNDPSVRFHESVGFENMGPFTADDGDAKVAFRLGLG